LITVLWSAVVKDENAALIFVAVDDPPAGLDGECACGNIANDQVGIG